VARINLVEPNAMAEEQRTRSGSDAVLGIFDWCSRVRGQCWSGCLFFSHIHYLVSIYIL
jgi:hypothetical protein